MTFSFSKIFNKVLFLLLIFIPSLGFSSPNKVLVVMSYEENNPWCKEIKSGIDGVLGKHADLTYFYMDTKANLAGGPEKAREAMALYEKLSPNGVITVDDNAQSMFVLPYLKDKVETPIMFCGVNAQAEKYGYPNSHISGTLERGHIRESAAFLKQLVPEFNSLCFVTKESPSGAALNHQVEGERDDYIVPVARFDQVSSLEQLNHLKEKLEKECSAIYVDSLEGIVDQQQRPLDNMEFLEQFSSIYKGPVIGANRYHVEQGALSAVVKTGEEQGELAAEMLLKALQGTPVSELPVTRNYKGRRLINVNTFNKLGIKPRPILLRGATLVRTNTK